MNPQNIALIIVFSLNVGLGLLIYLKGPHKRFNISFSIFSWASASWILSVLLAFSLEDPGWRLFFVRTSFVGPSIIIAAFSYFSVVFPKENSNISSTEIAIIYLLSAAFVILSFTPLMVQSVDWRAMKFKYGSVHQFFSIYFIVFMFRAIFSLIKSFRNSIGLERIQIKYCFLGIFLTAIPAITFNLILPALGTSRFSRLGPCSTLILLSFITYSVLKHRLMDINVVLKTGTTYGLLVVLLFIPSFLLILLGQKMFTKKVDVPFAIFVFLILLLAAILFYQIKPGAERVVEQFFFKKGYDYRETLGRFSKAMVTILDLQSLSKKIIETITQTMGVDKASLFLVNEEKGGYHLHEAKNVKKEAPFLHLPKDDPLPVYLKKTGEIIIREVLAKKANIPEIKDVVHKMSLLEAEVSIPLISKGQLIGMMNLSHKFNKDIYSQEDIELLGTLANETAIAVENARLYEDLKKSKIYMRRADRLASLGTLTAGISHEIRNPLVAIKTLTQLLPERIDDEEFRGEFLKIASGEVDRISFLVTELLEFARPSDPRLELEDINAILDGMVLLVSTETKKKQIEVTKDYSSGLPPIRIDREQMKQVFLNILLNAIEATSEDGKVFVKTRTFTKPGGESYVQIEFKDTGCGIPADQLESIFDPFFTTKKTGSGLGLSISNQIIEDHRGYIYVESQLHEGSSFFVNLPIDPASEKTMG